MAATKKLTLVPIAEHPEYKAAATVQQTLQAGLTALEQEKLALEIEYALPKAAPKAERTKLMTERLTAHRAKIPRSIEPVPPDVPRPVYLALEVIEGGTKLEVVRARRDREDLVAMIARVAADCRTVQTGIIAQTTVLDEIRDRLSFETATRLKAEHRSLIVQQYRAAQALSATTSAEQAFHRAVTDAGYGWRPDVLPAPAMRAALMIGDESIWDSEISRTRRILEELKVI